MKNSFEQLSETRKEKFLNRELKFIYKSFCKKNRGMSSSEIRKVLMETVEALAPSRDRTKIANEMRKRLKHTAIVGD